jgi:ABC-type maltose transport system permease subunit
MDTKTERQLLVDVSKISAMLDQHVTVSRHYRKRFQKHVDNHPSTRWVWAILVGAGWTATIAISVIALIM